MEFKTYLPNCSILLWLALHFEAGGSFGQIGQTVSAAVTAAARSSAPAKTNELIINLEYFTTYYQTCGCDLMFVSVAGPKLAHSTLLATR